MREARFWSLLDGARAGREVDIEALRTALRGLTDADLEGFDKVLQRKVRKLDSRAVRTALMGNPEVFDGEGWNDDGFEYLRLGIVALGERTYRSVLRDPSELAAGTWKEHEELSYAVQEVLEERYGADDDHPGEPLRWYATVNSEKYPVLPPVQVEEGFPVETFSWLQLDVQDSGQVPHRIYEYPGGEFFAYPDHEALSDYFSCAAHEAQEALRASIDFRRLPGLCLYLLVTVGESDSPPQWQLMPDFTHEEVSPGIATGLARERVGTLSSNELTALARTVVVDSLALYFEDHQAEQRQISELRRRLL